MIALLASCTKQADELVAPASAGTDNTCTGKSGGGECPADGGGQCGTTGHHDGQCPTGPGGGSTSDPGDLDGAKAVQGLQGGTAGWEWHGTVASGR